MKRRAEPVEDPLKRYQMQQGVRPSLIPRQAWRGVKTDVVHQRAGPGEELIDAVCSELLMVQGLHR